MWLKYFDIFYKGEAKEKKKKSQKKSNTERGRLPISITPSFVFVCCIMQGVKRPEEGQEVVVVCLGSIYALH